MEQQSLRIAILKREIHAGGGLEKYFRRIYGALVSRGHKVTVLSMEESKDVSAIKLGRKTPFSFLNMILFDYKARKWLSHNPQDVVLGLDRHFLPLTHYRAGNGCHAAFLERRKKESSWLKRLLLACNPLHIATLISEKRTFESETTKIVCNSNLVRNEIQRFYPKAHPQNIFVIHNGVEWQELEKPFRERRTTPFPHILFVGHEWQRKGLDRLLEALKFVKEPFFLTALGKERAPQKFSALVQKYELEGKVKLISQPQNPIPFYQEASIMVIPSRYDPFANVTLEALAMGLFVITTKANGGAEVLTPETGIVLEENATAEEFAFALESALRDPKDNLLIRESVKSFDFSKKLGEFEDFIFEKKGIVA